MPHLYLQGPWHHDRIVLDTAHRAYLERVLRRSEGDPLTYMDGVGTTGSGILEGTAVIRGEERLVERRVPSLSIAAAVPASKERARFLVEKLGELGVHRIIWMETQHGHERPPRVDRSLSWLISALEQSRGSWLTTVADQSVGVGDLEGPVWYADGNGVPPPEAPSVLTLAVGPEGGWAPGEIPEGATTVSLSPGVLRVETAAIVGAARILS